MGRIPAGPHLVLTGFMGTGKSVVGRQLAASLEKPFFDLDREIEAEVGSKIGEIFAQRGEEYFRRQESRLLARLLAREQPQVIAAGGGAVLRAANRELMQQRSTIIFLEATLETILERTAADNSRPLLAAAADRRGKIKDLLETRRSCYEFYHLKIITDGKTVAEITREIVSRLPG